MSKEIRGKGQPNDDARASGPVKTRGVEVIEDDPDTVWGLWDSALADMDSRFAGLPADAVARSSGSDRAPPAAGFDLTQPAALEEATPAQRMNQALEIVERYHLRVAQTIRLLWGYPECAVYIYKLIMSGGDGMGRARMGFHQEAVDAMLALAELHDSQFGSADDGAGPGYANPAVRPGLDGVR